MIDVGAIRRAMADALAPLVAGNASAYVLAQPTPPGVQILSPAIVYDYTMHRGLDQWNFIVQGFVAIDADIGSQMILDELLTPTSGVKGLLEADATLAALVENVHVTDQSEPIQTTAADGRPMLVVEWRVSMIVEGV